MCGIIAYAGRENACKLVMRGLKRLEYRGYDSWGIAVKNGSELVVKKAVGAISRAREMDYPSTLALGHTRWATHGRVSEINAHPHLSCCKNIAVVHNGIIENYAELKRELEERGHEFRSETDTEVIAHLIEDFLRNGRGFEKAFREALNLLRGSYALVAIHKDSDSLFFARKDSPLCLGLAEHGIFVASDPVAFLEHTKRVIFLDNGEFGVVNGNGNGKHVAIFDLKTGGKREKSPVTIEWNVEHARKGGFEYYMEKEIHEQRETIRKAISRSREEMERFAGIMDSAFGVFFIGSGSSYYACLASSYLFSKIAKKHVNVVDASEFGYYADFLTPRTLIVAVSQSGETADVLDAAKRAKERGARILAITNVIGSTLARMADYVIPMHAGPEICVVSTKTYTSQLSILTLLAYTLAGKYEEGKEKLEKAAAHVEHVLSKDMKRKLDELAERLKDKEHIFCLGRGVSHALAYEAALKIKEVTYLHAEGFSGGFLKHGTIALIERGTPCIIFAPLDETYDEIISNAAEVRARGAFVIGISPKRHEIFDCWIPVPHLGEASAILSIIPVQYLAYRIARLRGLDPDKPRNLAKSVTVK